MIRRVVGVVFFVIFPLVIWGGPLFDTKTGVREVSTKFFRIMYGVGDEKEASRLTAMVDDVYEEWAKRLQIPRMYPFLVILTRDIEVMNGMFTSFPRNTIILYNYMSDPRLVPSDDALKLLFTHELLHAISLNVRSSAWEFLANVVGDVASWQYVQQPWWMIEGITVSGESYGGHGRVNSPAHRAQLCQHLVEKQFLEYPDVVQFSSYGYHYLYGGFFSTYLQQKYGWDKYAQLWKQSARAFLPYSFESTFRLVYGVSMQREWRLFASNFVVSVTNVSLKEHILVRGKLADLRVVGTNLYLLDEGKEKVFRVEGRRLREVGEGTDVAQWGDTFALRKTRYHEGKPRDGFEVRRGKEVKFFSLVREMDIRKERMLLVFSDGLQSRLVAREKEKEREIFPARSDVQYLFPRFVSDEEAVFVLLLTNRPYLGVLNWQLGKSRLYDLSQYEVTSLAVVGREVWMTVFPREGNTLGRVGVFSLQNETLRVQKDDISGGLHSAVLAGEEVYAIRRKMAADELVVIPREVFVRELEGQQKGVASVSMEIVPEEAHVPSLVSKPAGRFFDIFPAVRIPLMYPHLSTLMVGSLFWNGWLYLYNEDPLQVNATTAHIHYLSFQQTFVVSLEWQNRYWYPFSTLLGVNAAVYNGQTYGKTLYGGFSYQWQLSPLSAVIWHNVVNMYPSMQDFGYSTYLAWYRVERMTPQRSEPPYPLYPGPLFFQGYVGRTGSYYTYGTLTGKWDTAFLSFLMGHGNMGFFSPFFTLSSFAPLFWENVGEEEKSSSFGRGTHSYTGVVGLHGLWYLPLAVKKGYKHFPLYFDSTGFVIGAYSLLLEERPSGGFQDFYGMYLQWYTRWIIGYIAPLSWLIEIHATSDALLFSSGFSLSL